MEENVAKEEQAIINTPTEKAQEDTEAEGVALFDNKVVNINSIPADYKITDQMKKKDGAQALKVFAVAYVGTLLFSMI